MTNINWYPGHMAKAKRLIKLQVDFMQRFKKNNKCETDENAAKKYRYCL